VSIASIEARGEDMYENLFLQLEQLLTYIYRADKDAKIFVYDEGRRKEDSTFITSVDNYRQITANRRMQTLTAYFDGANPRGDGSKMRMSMLIGTSSTHDDFRLEMKGWLEDNHHFFGERPLQLPNIVEVGWGLFSLPKTDAQALSEAVSAFCGFPVGCQWKSIATAQYEDVKVKAVHFTVDENFQSGDHRALCIVFKANKKFGFPLGILSWFVPLYFLSKGRIGKDQCIRMRARQEVFFQKIKMSNYFTRDWPTLDIKEVKLWGHTLREYLMDVRTKNNPDIQLFLGINKAWRKSGHIVTFLPKYADEAEQVVDGFLQYLRHYCRPPTPRHFNSLFSGAAITSAENTRWNPIEYRIQSAETEQLDDLDNPSSVQDWENLEDFDVETTPTVEVDRTEMEQAPARAPPTDVDTMFTPMTNIEMISLGPDRAHAQPTQQPQVRNVRIEIRPTLEDGVRYAVGAPVPLAPTRASRNSSTTRNP
jgi:hypothetical protein